MPPATETAAKHRRVVLATDHAGFTLKEAVKKHLGAQGIDVVDVGTFSEEPADYPAIIRKGCAVALEQGIPGVVFGGSGIGEDRREQGPRHPRRALLHGGGRAALPPAQRRERAESWGADSGSGACSGDGRRFPRNGV